MLPVVGVDRTVERRHDPGRRGRPARQRQRIADRDDRPRRPRVGPNRRACNACKPVRSTFTTARSSVVSVPRTVPSTVCPSSNVTFTSVAPATTWALVAIRPSASMTKPVPAPSTVVVWKMSPGSITVVRIETTPSRTSATSLLTSNDVTRGAQFMDRLRRLPNRGGRRPTAVLPADDPLSSPASTRATADAATAADAVRTPARNHTVAAEAWEVVAGLPTRPVGWMVCSVGRPADRASTPVRGGEG